MEVKLLNATPINIALEAGLICTDSEDKIDNYDSKEFISKLVSQGHESVIEHISYNFRVMGISRACLQELARHRHISLSVKSTRWALDKHSKYYTPLELEEPDAEDWKYALDGVLADAKTLKAAYGNDVAKYLLPECVVTDLILTLNLRELRHIYKLRTARNAMLEFQHLAKALVACLPDDEQELVRYRSDALERAVQEFLETGSDEAREEMATLAAVVLGLKWGGESPMTRETEAVELLHRVLNYFVGEFAFPEKMERLLEEIEVFLTDIEAEERDALRK